jgi:hypothetical protein
LPAAWLLRLPLICLFLTTSACLSRLAQEAEVKARFQAAMALTDVEHQEMANYLPAAPVTAPKAGVRCTSWAPA